MLNKILVATGGRWYENNGFVVDYLDEFQPTMVIHGGAIGADSLVDGWAKNYSVPRVIFGLTDFGENGWLLNGLRAGPLRNQAMIEFARKLRARDMLGEPLWVVDDTEIRGVAFPGRDGTNDMCKRMRAAGLIFEDFRHSVDARRGSCYAKDMQRR